MGKEKIRKKGKKKIEQKLESIEKFLGTRKLEEEPCYESSKKEIVSYTFEHLIYNIKIHNGVKI